MARKFVDNCKRFLVGENVNETKGVKIGLAICSIVLFIWSLTLIYPFAWALINTFKSPREFSSDSFGLPPVWRFDNWSKAFDKLQVNTLSGPVGLWGMIFNSLWYTFIGSLLTIVPCIMFSYAVAKYKFRHCKFLYTFAVIVMMIPIYGSMPANIKIFHEWGLMNTPLFLVGGMGVIHKDGGVIR